MTAITSIISLYSGDFLQAENIPVPENWSGSFECLENDHSNCAAIDLRCTKISFTLLTQSQNLYMCGKTDHYDKVEKVLKKWRAEEVSVVVSINDDDHHGTPIIVYVAIGLTGLALFIIIAIIIKKRKNKTIQGRLQY